MADAITTPGVPGLVPPIEAASGSPAPATPPPAAHPDGREAEVDAQIVTLKAKIAERDRLKRIANAPDEPAPPKADGKPIPDVEASIAAAVERRFAEADARLTAQRRLEEIRGVFRQAGGLEEYEPDIAHWLTTLGDGASALGAREVVHQLRERRPSAFTRAGQSPGAASGGRGPTSAIDIHNPQPGDIGRMTPEQWEAFKALRDGKRGVGGFM